MLRSPSLSLGDLGPTIILDSSEYLADCDERRAFISGFNGSAGMFLDPMNLTLFTEIYDQDVQLSLLQKPFCSPMEGISYRQRNSWIRRAYSIIEVC